MIYMSECVVNANDWSSVANANYGLWVAKYRDNTADYNYDMSNAGNKPNVKYWSFYAIWQWTSSGRLDGYNGNLDCNEFYGDTTAWDKYVGNKQTTETTNTSTASTLKYKVGDRVKSGDTLSGIAAKYGTTYQELAAKNGIADPDKIYSGQVLRI